MGVIAVDVVKHAAFLQENELQARDTLHRQSLTSSTTTARQERRSFKPQATPSPSLHSKPRRLLVRRSLTPRASVMRPSSVSISEPPASQLLYCSLDAQSSSLPAPASGAQPLCLQPDGRRTTSFDSTVNDDLPVDYKEAAAALEQLFSESPSLQNGRIFDGYGSSSDDGRGPSQIAGRTESRPSLVSTKRQRRKDLTARISLRRRKMALGQGNDIVAAAQASGRLGAVEELSESIWSGAAAKLLQQHGEAVNLMAQDWSTLSKELLSAEGERWLALLMKPAKDLKVVRERLRQRLGRNVREEEWAQAAQMNLPTLARHLALHHAARNKLVKLNLRLVRHQARKYEKETPASSLTAVDLCQEGVKGLFVAADRFEPSKGVRFSSYAIFWIRNSILRAQIRSGYPIRSPFNFAEIKMNIKKAKWEMRLEGEDFGDGKVGGRKMKRMLERAGIDEDRYKVVMQSNRRVVSLHKRDPVTGAERIEHLADPNGASSNLLGHGATDPSVRLGIDDVLDSLNPKESLVLRQRFGLDGKGERALGEIGRNMRMSREMVRRYEARGLLKLKHPTRLHYLRSLLSQDL